MDLKKIMRDAISGNKIISAYCNRNDWSKFALGRPLAFDSQFFIVKSINAEGESDGYVVRLLEDLNRIDVDGKYERKIEFLYDQIKQGVSKNSLEADSIVDILNDSISFAIKDHSIVSIWADDPDYPVCGHIARKNGTLVEVERIDDYGCVDGRAYIDAEQIIAMNINARDDRTRKTLYLSKIFWKD